MNWNLVLALSLPGLAIGLAVDIGLGEAPMWVLWVVLRLISAIWIARTLVSRHLLHGFLIGFLGAGSAVLSGAILFETYTSNHPEYLESAKQMSAEIDPRTLLFLIAAAVGIVHGIAQAILAVIAGRIVAPRPAG